MMHFLTFAGKSSLDFGIRISGESTYNSPERKYDEVKVAGRNGTLLLDEHSFKNISVEYPAFAVDDMPQRVRDFVNYMNSFAGYQRLEDTYAPDVFRLAQYKGGMSVKSKGYMNRQGEFDIEFNCKPQRFLKSGEIPQTFNTNGSFYNRTNFASQPFLRVYGSAAGTVGLGSYIITISQINEYVDIDCELMDAYKGATNCNANVSFNADEIKLLSGTNGITFTGGITSVILTPRTYIL